jgi:hypothetical protein
MDCSAEQGASCNITARAHVYICVVTAAALPAAIATPGDDGNYGSAATLDVLALQALSKRIHYGKFVAEAKFRWAPQLCTDHDQETAGATCADVCCMCSRYTAVYLWFASNYVHGCLQQLRIGTCSCRATVEQRVLVHVTDAHAHTVCLLSIYKHVLCSGLMHC